MGKMTGIYQCPACSAPVTFRSGETRLIVCPSCSTALNRLESDDLVVSQAAVIKDHNDLIRSGSKGIIQDQPFEILGRFRVWLDESVMNYWTVLVKGSALCILAEGYGMYAFLRRITLDKALTPSGIDQLKSLDSLPLLGEDAYFLQRKDDCWKYEVEGEVWMPECNSTFRIFDFYARGSKHIELIEFLPNFLAAYELRYTDFSSLQLTGLNDKPVTPKELTCTQCRSNIRVKTFPYAQSCSCPGCGARFVFKDSGEFRSSGKDKINQNQLALPLGAVGTLQGISYEVVGYALKEENTPAAASWKEYVLYNRAEGYAFLSEYRGSWLYAREKGDSPVLATNDASALTYQGVKFSLYNKYRIRILDTAGEFPYNIYDDTNIDSAEFIAPPQMWVFEKSREEGINWFLARHLDRDELLQQFPYDLPDQVETGVLDPKGFSSLRSLLIVTAVAIAVLVGVHLLIGASQQQRILLDKDILLPDSTASTSFASSKFQLTKFSSNLQFDIEAPVDNSWLDMDASLVDDRTGKEYVIQQVVQYYHGYEDGESWSEGSTRETVWLNSIPSGTYFLRIQASRDTTAGGWNGLRDFRLTVKNDVPSNRNLWIFIGLLLIWPIVQLCRILFFESRRWEGSLYSPYKRKTKK